MGVLCTRLQRILYDSFFSISLNRTKNLLVGIKIQWLIQSDFVCINREEAWDFCGDKHSFNDLSFTQLLIICVVISCLSFAFNYTLPTQLNIKEYLHTRRNQKNYFYYSCNCVINTPSFMSMFFCFRDFLICVENGFWHLCD